MYRRLLRWLTSPSADTAESRRAARIFEPGVLVYYWDGSIPIAHQLRDISETGAYIYTTERWYVGTIVRLLLRETRGVPADQDAHASVSIPARVVWHGSDGMALEFLFPTERDRTLLTRVIGAGSDLNTVRTNTVRTIAGV